MLVVPLFDSKLQLNCNLRWELRWGKRSKSNLYFRYSLLGTKRRVSERITWRFGINWRRPLTNNDRVFRVRILDTWQWLKNGISRLLSSTQQSNIHFFEWMIPFHLSKQWECVDVSFHSLWSLSQTGVWWECVLQSDEHVGNEFDFYDWGRNLCLRTRDERERREARVLYYLSSEQFWWEAKTSKSSLSIEPFNERSFPSRGRITLRGFEVVLYDCFSLVSIIISRVIGTSTLFSVSSDIHVDFCCQNNDYLFSLMDVLISSIDFRDKEGTSQ
jgi:hypothetical protein